ncbi:hypothetical protein NQ318_015401 [Aromia moschata]|uniref:Mos1 transposase HTH domain-containing protein n=1 Tax=Aromia moschata TaxID=1265417 RepID=A0AAV8YSZ7_9CUCU|nr:hypothetical protein NQ318_015401 [Aromia moschata]
MYTSPKIVKFDSLLTAVIKSKFILDFRFVISDLKNHSFELVDAPVMRRKSVQLEQQVSLNFHVELGKTFTKAYAMLKEVYGNECLSLTQVFEWFKRFKEGREASENDPRPEWPSTSKMDKNFEKKW